MSKPRRNDRCEWLRERIADATKAAADGQGWTFLANLWECSNANALQWSRENVDPEICAIIGKNGMHLRYPNIGRKYNREDRMKPTQKPARQSNGRVRYLTCQHILYIDGKTEMCGADTVAGHHACPSCRKRESASEGFRLRDLRLVQY